MSGEVVVNFNVSRGCGVSVRRGYGIVMSEEVMVYLNVRRSFWCILTSGEVVVYINVRRGYGVS
jgi:hypothetical protein